MTAPSFWDSPRRIGAMIMRYRFLMMASWPRLLELAYWPTIQMILWGLINRFMVTQSDGMAQSAGLLIAAALLWDVLYRAQLGVSLVFFEEMYARNLGNLFVSPLRPYELALSLLTISLLRTLFGVGVAGGLAIGLYHYSIFDMGLPLIALFINLLIMGWAIGLMIVAMVLRYGLGMEGFAWAVIFAFAPLSGVYYPISILPEWLQPVAQLLPSSHVFEGMRLIMNDHVFSITHVIAAAERNVVFMIIALTLYSFAFYSARQRGLLLQMGE